MESGIVINFQELSFFERFSKSLVNWGTAYFLLFIILGGIYIHYLISIVMICWLFYDIYKSYTESDIYITSILIDGDVINILFLQKDKKNKFVINKAELHVDWYQSVKGIRTPSNIKIYNGDELKLVQYGIGKWSRSEIERVGNLLKK